MEEVWLERFPGEESSIHLQDIPDEQKAWLNEALAAKWARIRAARRVVTGALEFARQDKLIGSSLEAAPVVHLGTVAVYWASIEEAQAELASVDFAEICITSDISVTNERAQGYAGGDWTTQAVVEVRLAQGEKCRRCWKILPDVGSHKHPHTCARCNDALG
jgi:isoleucyl-tRNA synthetase